MTARTAAIVVGAGISGLCAALLLARRGWHVTLVEAQKRVGMTLRGFTRQGVYFDTGLHYTGGLGEHGALSRYFRHLGLDLEPISFAESGFDAVRLTNSGKTVHFRTGPREFAEGITEAFPAHAREIDAFTADLLVAYHSSEYLTPRRPAPELVESALKLDAVTLAERLAVIDDPELRHTLECHTLLHGTPASSVSMLLHGRILGSYLYGVHTVRGGGRRLIRALEGACRTAGVVVRLGARMRQVRCLDGRVREVCLEDGECLPASVVLYTGPPEAVPSFFEPGVLRPAYIARVRSLEPTPSACMLFGKVEKIPPALNGCNLFFLDREGTAKAFSPTAHPENGPFFVTATPDPDGGPGGGVTVIAPASIIDFRKYFDSSPQARPAAYLACKSDLLGGMERRIRALCPELRDVRFIDGATPATLAHYLGNPSGALYGIRRPNFGFAPQVLNRVSGFLAAGQGVVAPGVLGAVISAYVACGMLVGLDDLRREVMQ